MKKQLGLVAVMAMMSAFAVSANSTGAVATGTMATGTVATGMTVEEKTAKVHGILDEFFKKNSKKTSEKKSFIAGLVATLKDAEAKLEKRFESFKADYALVISALENYKI